MRTPTPKGMDMTERGKKKRFRIFIDDVKIRHTSHWDEDFMSREELDAVYAKPAPEAAAQAERAGKEDDDKA